MKLITLDEVYKIWENFNKTLWRDGKHFIVSNLLNSEYNYDLIYIRKFEDLCELLKSHVGNYKII